MHTHMVLVFALIVTAIVSFGFEAMAVSKSHGGFETLAASKKCQKGYIYSEAKKKCVRKGHRRPMDKS